jgi:hypothetical protein
LACFRQPNFMEHPTSAEESRSHPVFKQLIEGEVTRDPGMSASSVPLSSRFTKRAQRHRRDNAFTFLRRPIFLFGRVRIRIAKDRDRGANPLSRKDRWKPTVRI